MLFRSVEQYAGRRGIVNRARSLLRRGAQSCIEEFLEEGEITPRTLSRAAERGDEVALTTLRETGQFIGIAMASLVNTLNPEALIVGGGVSNAGEYILEPLRTEIRRRAYTSQVYEVKVLRAGLKNDSGIVGAAGIAVGALGG